MAEQPGPPVNDQLDAQAIVDVVKALLPHWERRPAACGRMVRHALDRLWDAPRSTKQGHRRRDPDALWSPAALDVAKQAMREEAEAANGRRSDRWQSLVGEHVVPAKIQIEELVRLVRADASLGEIIAVSRPHIAIVTKAEDSLLRTRGLTDSMPPGWSWGGDPWERYTEAGFPRERFLTWPGDG